MGGPQRYQREGTSLHPAVDGHDRDSRGLSQMGAGRHEHDPDPHGRHVQITRYKMINLHLIYPEIALSALALGLMVSDIFVAPRHGRLLYHLAWLVSIVTLCLIG